MSVKLAVSVATAPWDYLAATLAPVVDPCIWAQPVEGQNGLFALREYSWNKQDITKQSRFLICPALLDSNMEYTMVKMKMKEAWL